MKKQDLKKIENIFKNDKNISLVLLFGSQATGRANKISDVDIAILLNKNQDSYFKIKIKYLGKIKEVLKRDDIDLVVINEATPFLNYQIMKTGKVIYQKSQDDYCAFNIKTMRVYEDNKHIPDIGYQAMEERIKNNTFGTPIKI